MPLRIIELLAESNSTQVELAKFCGISQGSISDHISGRSFPKTTLLIQYGRFFTRKLGRKITLYDLTGLDAMKELEPGITPIPRNEKTAKLIEFYEALDDNDPRKKAINALLGLEPDKEEK